MKTPKQIPEWLKLANPKGYLNRRDMESLFSCSRSSVARINIPVTRSLSTMTNGTQVRKLWNVKDVIKFIKDENAKNN